LSLSNDFATYSDTYDSQTGIITRRVGKLTYDSTLSYSYVLNNDPNWCSIYISKRSLANSTNGYNGMINLLQAPVLCSHAPYVYEHPYTYLVRTKIGVMGYSDASAFVIHTFPVSLFPDKESWIQFITNNEVKVWYPLAEPIYE
jgi:hypothetical protein